MISLGRNRGFVLSNFPEIAVVHMSLAGPEPTSDHVRCSVAIAGKTDMTRSSQKCSD